MKNFLHTLLLFPGLVFAQIAGIEVQDLSPANVAVGTELVAVAQIGVTGGYTPPAVCQGMYCGAAMSLNQVRAFINGGVVGLVVGNGPASSFTAAASADVLALFTGTKDSSHCPSGAGTMVACSGGGGGGTPGGTNGQLQYNNSGAFGGITLVPIANGGSNAATANAALNNFLPNQVGIPSGYALETDGANTSWEPVAGGGTVNIGVAGQVAYYPAGTAAVSGENQVTPAQGGDGINNGSATETRLYSVAFNGTGPVVIVGQGNTVATLPPGTVSLGYLGTPIVGGAPRTSGGTMVLADQGEKYQYNCAGACTHVIPANASVAFPVGSWVIIDNLCTATGTLTISVTSDSLFFRPSALPGNRTVPPCGEVILEKETATSWATSGAGES